MDNILQIYGQKFYAKLKNFKKNTEDSAILIFLRKRQLMDKKDFNYQNIANIRLHPYYLHFIFTFYNAEYLNFKKLLVEGISQIKGDSDFINNEIFKVVDVVDMGERKKRKIVQYYKIDFGKLNLFIANILKDKFAEKFFPVAVFSRLEIKIMHEQLILHIFTKDMNIFNRRILLYLYEKGELEEEQLLVELLIPREKYKYHLIDLFKIGYIMINGGKVRLNIKKAIKYNINKLLYEKKYCTIANAEKIIFLNEYIKIFE